MTIIYLILAALALGLLVFIHELGHFFAARSVGMIVEAFSIGFGPSLFKWRSKNGVEWRIGIVPLGGYVRIAGMDFKKKKMEEETLGYELINPYDIKGGFYSKSPLKRIYVLIAGPLSNVIFAMIVFFAIWCLGGRDKSFSELTQVVGWVSPSSEFYKAGLRNGDRILVCNNKEYEGIKDILYASVMNSPSLIIGGERYDFSKNNFNNFNIEVKPRINAISPQTPFTLPFSSARYLIYTSSKVQENKLPPGSPMLESGIVNGDRLVWMDGQLLFSLDQMSSLLNEQYALLTIKRNDQIFLSRQPRILAGEMSLPIYLRNDLIDCQYEAYLKGKWSSLYILPYVIGNNCYIEKLLPLSINLLDELKINKDSYSTLQVGDLILAVDGQPVYSNYEILKLIQNHQALIIVKRDVQNAKIPEYSFQEDNNFFKSFDFLELEKISTSIGTDHVNKTSGKFVLLNPVIPRRWEQFHVSKENKNKFLEEMERQKQLISTIKNKAKKAVLLEQLEESKKRVMLGIQLQDLIVKYNPSPLKLFLSTFSETTRTLKGLFSGKVNVKWLSGPIGIVQALHHGWSLGINEALFWIGLISVNLAVLNLLPIPVLDGGYIVFSLWEWISGKRLNLKLIERLLIPFIILLVLLFVLLTFQDVIRLIY